MGLGGPLSEARSSARTRLDVPARRLERLFEDPELARREPVLPAAAPATRGYKNLHAEHVLQADAGCDLDFLTQRP